MSCRPAVMPATKKYIVRRLDSVEQEVTLLKKATGADCLDRVCRTLSILEKDYFGLRYLDKNDEYLWINLRNPLHEQLVPGVRPVMEMRVKYFVKPQKLLQPSTRLHFYKQLKKDLLQGKLKVNTLSKASKLTALMAQIDKGDYRVGIQYNHKVICQTDNDNMDAKTRREHQKLAGTSNDIATEKFLEEAAALELYGVELYHVLDGHRVPKIIGVGPENVQIYSSSMELEKRFPYASVQYTAFHAKKFTALVSSSNKAGRPEQADFELKSRAAAQALYRTITEFHTFFRRGSVSRVVKTAGYCKSLLGNFKGQNPDRFYFDVMKTHREVVDHVWSILHPSTTLVHDDDTESNVSGSSTTSSTAASTTTTTTSAGSESHHHHSSSRSSRNHRHNRQGDRLTTVRSSSSNSHHRSSPTPPSTDNGNPPPLPPPGRNMQRSMPRSRSVQDTNIRPLLNQMPPLPPYSQRSCSSDVLLRTSNLSRRSNGSRPLPTHGPHMASTASFNPYLSPSISETGSDSEEQSLYASGGSDCYGGSTRSEPTYMPSTHSDPGSRAFACHTSTSDINPSACSETSGAPSDMYITSVDSECSAASFRVSSPPPLYTEVDPEHTVPLNFSDQVPNSAGMSLVSPIIPIAGESAVFNFDAAAVLTRTRELEGELQRLRTAMTCRLCKQNPIGATFCPCGHTVCCYQCAQRLRTCWECDERVHSVQRMLLAR